ncbi:hypothetical protein GCM10023144_46920 [Pigmentiphaga soli]|uniref:DUF481 domain-containing protein n=1 Tax=Pigmentiphaga soli TaxID=1007095 RepID=A0ABP8HSH3_9BURK
MTKTRHLVSAAALLACSHAWAQAPMKPDGAWRGAVNAGLSFAKGNTDATSVNVDANAGRATQDDRLNFYLTSLYGTKKDNGVSDETANLLRLGGKYDRDLTGRVFAFGSLDAEHDKLQELDLRTVLAGGAGYHVIKNENTLFDLFSGLSYNREKFTTETRNSLEVLLGEESNHKLTETSSLHQRFAVYPNVSDGGEYRIQFDAGVTTSITRRIELKLTLSNRYQSNPLPGVKKSDTLLLTSIGYRLGPD